VRKDSNLLVDGAIDAVLTTVFLVSTLAWHDHLLITLSLVSAYLFIRFLDGYIENGTGESWRLYGTAGTIALALLSKYNAVFVVLGFVATLIVDKRLHPLWRDRRLYFGRHYHTYGLNSYIFMESF
jgi:4-amino-4-deoxy-L-arabinose transferase-like glycosyltransferase